MSDYGVPIAYLHAQHLRFEDVSGVPSIGYILGMEVKEMGATIMRHVNSEPILDVPQSVYAGIPLEDDLWFLTDKLQTSTCLYKLWSKDKIAICKSRSQSALSRAQTSHRGANNKSTGHLSSPMATFYIPRLFTSISLSLLSARHDTPPHRYQGHYKTTHTEDQGRSWVLCYQG